MPEFNIGNMNYYRRLEVQKKALSDAMNTISRMWEVVDDKEISDADVKAISVSLSGWYNLLDKKQDEIVIELQEILENSV